MQESANLEDIQVVHAGMNTLRLMENDDTRLRLIYQPSGKEIFDIPLTPYLLLSRNVETTYMPPQEYLDRQDRYNLIFFPEPDRGSAETLHMFTNASKRLDNTYK